jgi:hypothetical protein
MAHLIQVVAGLEVEEEALVIQLQEELEVQG